MDKKTYFWQGNEAMAYGAFDAGARFYAGYPITPSSEIAEISSIMLPKLGGIYIQMEDELSSMAAIIGASAAGKIAFTATSGPGFSLMQENLGVAVMAQLPCVVINVQRFGPSTGMATKPAQSDVMQSRWGTHGDHGIIVLSPSSVEDCYYLTVRAFKLAYKYRTPVIVLADEIIGHLRERADIVRDEGNCEIGIPDNLPENFKPFDMSGIYENNIAPLVPFGKGKIVRFSGSIYNEWGQTDNSPQNAARLARHLTEKIENNKDDIVTVRHFNNEDDIDVAIVAYGCTARAAMESVKQLRSEGIKAGLLQLVTIWPFADKYVTEICKASHAVIVPEMNLGQIVSEVKRCAGNTPVIPVNRLDGMMITPSEISMHVKEALQRWI